MATLTVWKFDDPGGAARARYQVELLQAQGSIEVHDTVVVTWPIGATKPSIGQHTSSSSTGSGTASGAFWGLLLGLVFSVPIFGLAFGATAGALKGSLSGFGIDDEFVDDVRERVSPGTSALFVVSSDAVVDEVRSQLDLSHAELIRTNLAVEDEEALREAFLG